MSDKIEDIVIQSLTNASSRVRWTIFANLTLSAIIFSNIYVSYLSHDLRLIEQARLFVSIAEKEMRDIETKYNVHKTNLDMTTWDQDDQFRYSDLSARQARAQNTLNDLKLPTAEVPMIGFRVPSNDLNIICGFFMIIFSQWLVFSANQINDMFEDDDSKKVLDKYSSVVRHIFATIYSSPHDKLKLVTRFMIFVPGFAILLSLVAELISIKGYEFGILLSQMTMSLFIRFVILTAIAIILIWSSSNAWNRWLSIRVDLGAPN